jgi:hypothetical protein
MAPQWTDTCHLENIDRLADALDRGRPQAAQFEIIFDQPRGILINDYTADWRGGLHSRGEIAHQADWRVFNVSSGFERAHNDFAGTYPNARLQG